MDSITPNLGSYLVKNYHNILSIALLWGASAHVDYLIAEADNKLHSHNFLRTDQTYNVSLHKQGDMLVVNGKYTEECRILMSGLASDDQTSVKHVINTLMRDDEWVNVKIKDNHLIIYKTSWIPTEFYVLENVTNNIDNFQDLLEAKVVTDYGYITETQCKMFKYLISQGYFENTIFLLYKNLFLIVKSEEVYTVIYSDVNSYVRMFTLSHANSFVKGFVFVDGYISTIFHPNLDANLNDSIVYYLPRNKMFRFTKMKKEIRDLIDTEDYLKIMEHVDMDEINRVKLSC